MKTVVLYARVSTDKQTHDSQLHELRAYCTTRGWDSPLELVDTVSGASTARSGLDELMKLVRGRKVAAVVVYKLDRLARSLPHLAQILAELDAHRVPLIAPGQGIDTSTDNPAGRLQLHILGAIAQFERSVITERINAGLAVAKAKGVRLGRPKTMQKHVVRVTALVAEGMSARRIAVTLGISRESASKLVSEVKASTSDETALAA